MNLTEPQAQAMIELGQSSEGHGFIPQRILNELLSYELIYWRNTDEVDFTAVGKEVYDELVGSTKKELAGGTPRGG